MSVETTTMAGRQIGRSLPRLEAREKVTGRAEYTHTMRVPGMLVGKIFRSTVAHGRIKSIHTAAAQKIAGVHSVITGEDIRKIIPDPYYGPAFHDQPILAIDKVRFVGEPVAVVLAYDAHIAEAATHGIHAQYEELPAVYDEVEAMTSPVTVHDELRPAGSFADLKHLKGRKGTNLALDASLRRGDVEQAFASAAHIFEHTFRTQKCLHLALEPFASIADARDSGVTIYTSSQGPSFLRTEIARLLQCPENRVRIKVPFVGGGYGSKIYVKLEALVTALSLLARRPVKIALTMEEQFYQITKHPSTLRIKTALDKDKRITARRCEVFWNGGAYADIGPRVTQKSGICGSRAVRYRERVDQFLRALYPHDTVRRAARFRSAAARVGLREPHRYGGKRAQARSDRLPTQEPPARRPSARKRHHFEGCPDRGRARPGMRTDALAGTHSTAEKGVCAEGGVSPSR